MSLVARVTSSWYFLAAAGASRSRALIVTVYVIAFLRRALESCDGLLVISLWCADQHLRTPPGGDGRGRPRGGIPSWSAGPAPVGVPRAESQAPDCPRRDWRGALG